MAHYAFINNQNIVVQVIVGRDEDDLENLPEGFDSWESYYSELHNMKCLRTSYNTHHNKHFYYDSEGQEQPTDTQEKALRGNYAGEGFTYDPVNDVFIRPKPFESWILNEEIWDWEAPVPYPDDNQYYEWSDKAQNWVLIP